jgi:hypothetical protein
MPLNLEESAIRGTRMAAEANSKILLNKNEEHQQQILVGRCCCRVVNVVLVLINYPSAKKELTYFQFLKVNVTLALLIAALPGLQKSQ